MKVFIITIDDPVQTTPFVKKVILAKKDWIAGVAIAKGSRLTIGKKKSKPAYLISLLLILGPFVFLKNAWRSLFNKLINKVAPVCAMAKRKTFAGWLESQGIDVMKIDSPNAAGFVDYLKSKHVDVIINQSSAILKKELLGVPKIGTINRHNALLPKNRGRMTPFWVLYRQEKETGVSIHFVNEHIDDGPIVVQKRFAVSPKESINSLVKKNYEIAPLAMIEALDKLNAGENIYLPNSRNSATYNTAPGLKEAFRYRTRRIKRFFGGF